MRIVLVTLSGDAEIARHALNSRYPGAEIADFPRASLEAGGLLKRLRALRILRPDVFAVMTESLAWQYGQDALMLFGALGGASESLVLDSRGNLRALSQLGLLAWSAFRIADDLFRGWLGVRRARKRLGGLEKEVQMASKRPKISSPRHDSVVSMAYLRTTPAAGTEAGGVTSHILGVVDALIKC